MSLLPLNNYAYFLNSVSRICDHSFVLKKNAVFSLLRPLQHKNWFHIYNQRITLISNANKGSVVIDVETQAFLFATAYCSQSVTNPLPLPVSPRRRRALNTVHFSRVSHGVLV